MGKSPKQPHEPTYTNEQFEALHRAIREGSVNECRTCLESLPTREALSLVTKQDTHGNNALHYATKRREDSPEVYDFIIAIAQTAAKDAKKWSDSAQKVTHVPHTERRSTPARVA